MAALADRVKDSTTTTGTGNITLSGTAATGYRDFNSVFGTGSGNAFYYAISSNGGVEWETGIGYLSASTTLVRQTVTASSNSGSLVSFSAGTKDVYCTLTASYANFAKNSLPPRVVKNLLSQEYRFLTASVFGTGTQTPSTVATSYGIKNGIIAMSTGTAGRAFFTLNYTLAAGQWYALSFEITALTLTSTANCGVMMTTGTVDIGISSITDTKIIPGGVGRYSMAFMSRAGGAVAFRAGVGVQGNEANQSLTMKNVMIQAVDYATSSMVCDEYVYPGYSAAFNYYRALSVDVNNKVTEATTKTYFNVRPFSNILAIGDSRSDEVTNIPDALNTILGSNGVCNYHAHSGWTSANMTGPTVINSVSLNFTDALAGNSGFRTFSTAGDEQLWDYADSRYYSYDTLFVSDFGVNDIAQATSGQESAAATTCYSTIVGFANAALAKGMRVIIGDNNPFKTNAVWSTATDTAVKQLNRDLKNWCTANGQIFVSAYYLLSDSTDPDKLSDGAGTTPDYHQDTLHLNAAGSLVYATAVYNTILAQQSLNKGITAPPGTATTQLATTAFVTAADNLKANTASPTFTGTVTLPNGSVADSAGNIASVGTVSGSSATGFRNKLINGDFQVWQRGTSFTDPTGASNMYCADRWASFRAAWAAGITTTQQSTQVNSKSVRVQRNASNASTAALQLNQTLETIEVKKLAGKVIALQLKALAGANFSSASSLITIQIVYGTGTDGNLGAGLTGQTTLVSSNVVLTATNTQFSVTGTLPTNATQLGVMIFYTPVGTAGANDYFEITDVQLEEGAIATPFERRTYGLELSLCQRYCRAISVYVGGAALPTEYAISMRATPTVTGGGTGFSSTNTTSDVLYCSQTTAAAQTLVLTSEI